MFVSGLIENTLRRRAHPRELLEGLWEGWEGGYQFSAAPWSSGKNLSLDFSLDFSFEKISDCI